MQVNQHGTTRRGNPNRKIASITSALQSIGALRIKPGWSGWSRIVPLVRPLQHLIYMLGALMPRDPRLWVFGSWSGLRYADNAAALFRHSSAVAEENLRVVWITRDRAIRQDLRQSGYRAHLKWSIPGMWLTLRAGVHIFDGLTKDINHWASLGARRVLLRHGVGIKKIERAIDQPEHRLYRLFHGSTWQRLAWTFLIPWHNVRPDLVLASSKVHAEQGERFFDVPEQATAVTGMPRNDVLYGQNLEATLPSDVAAWIAETRVAGRSLVLYLPTFRDDGSSTFAFNWAEFDARLAGTQANMIIKLHPADKSSSQTDFANLKHVLRVPAKVDLAALLPIADSLATDYSSVVYDFMLFRRPLIFFHPDLDTYQRFSRTLDIPYEDVTPGWHAQDMDELVDAIANATEGKDSLGCDSEHYENVLRMFHRFEDGKACERAHNEIMKRFASPNSRERTA